MFSPSISHFMEMLVDYWDSSWLIEIILLSVLSLASPLGYLIPMLLGKKSIYLEAILLA